jgi:hypothetical protein
MAERTKRFSDSSILIQSFSKLFDPELTSSAEICLYDEPSIQELKARKPARFRVFMTRLEPRVKIYSDEKLTNTVAVSKDYAENTIAEGDATLELGSAYLFDASGIGRLMCIGVGRYPHNLLRPFIGESADAYYDSPDAFDPDCVCGQISRDHGLVFLDDKANIYYRDFGTKKEGKRRGSKNGTWLNGEEAIRDLVIRWHEGDYLGIGGRAWVRRDGQLVKEHVFKLRYERVPEPHDTQPEIELSPPHGSQ